MDKCKECQNGEVVLKTASRSIKQVKNVVYLAKAELAGRI